MTLALGSRFCDIHSLSRMTEESGPVIISHCWYLSLQYSVVLLVWMNAAIHVVSDTQQYDHGLSHLPHDELYWLDVPQRVQYKLCATVHLPHDKLYWLDVPQRVQYKLCATVHRCLQHRAPQYMMDCCIHTSDIARHQHLQSAGCHQLFILRHRHSVFGRWTSSIAGPAELVTRLPARSVTFVWQFSPGAENFSFLVYFFCFHGWQFLTTGKVKCKNNNITMCQMPLDAFLLSTCAPTFSWKPVLAGCHVILRVLDANCHVAGSVFFCIPPVTRRHQCQKSWSFALSGKCPCGRQ